MKSEARVWHLRELFMEVRRCALEDTAMSALTTRFPEYLPPVYLKTGVTELFCQAARCLQKYCDPADMLLVSGRYEDHRDSADCCVVLSLQLQRPGLQDGFCVENEWLEEFGFIAEELLSASVDLKIESDRNSLSLEFRLPVHSDSTSCVPHRDAVLLVEDDPFVRNASREVLERAGYRVVVAGNAEEALKAFHRIRQRICMAISDVTMPGRDGRNLARVLQASMPQLPVILMSGYSNPVNENLPQRLYYLSKPFNADGLLQAIHRGLAAHHQLTFGPQQSSGMISSLLGSAK